MAEENNANSNPETQLRKKKKKMTLGVIDSLNFTTALFICFVSVVFYRSVCSMLPSDQIWMPWRCFLLVIMIVVAVMHKTLQSSSGG
ncbi:hypothetical protein BVC80_9011g54 [Macleaya cordata]|uniref:Uncharacterized protein n=1 Tax=Macleaya cordata TaxID=56857 RepID=A0A200QQ08_MACCD|nr:hypothetical protein BVC80_9011g54 [Macleaya cordata]